MKTAVVVAHPMDVHAHAVRTAVTRLGGRACVLDAGHFAPSSTLRTRIGPGGADLEVSWQDEGGGGTLRSGDVTGVWWRRLSYPMDPAEAPEQATMLSSVIREERRSALTGSLHALTGNAFNDLGRSRQAAHKPTQLVRARAHGLRVPETLITNDPQAVRDFYARLGGSVVFKMFRGAPHGLYGTRMLRERELGMLDRLPTCPAIFQEFIPGQYDVRAVVVGEQVFAAKLDYEPLGDVIDTRFVDAGVSACSLPETLTAQLVGLVSDFGLVYSSIDLRFSETEGYVFFESNPEGQYLWVEIEAELQISEAIARRLLDGPLVA